MKFIIISAVYNMSEQLKNNIDVLKSQTYTNFEVYFGDDLSTDNSRYIIDENIKDDDRFHLVEHNVKLFSMGNIAETIKIANPNKEDIIVLIDGDDCLADSTSLEYLKSAYDTNQCWMTFGSYTVNGVLGSNCSPYSSFTKRYSLYRFTKWRANHLKTFKYFLWKYVSPKSLTIEEHELSRVLKYYFFTCQFRAWWNTRRIKFEDLVTENKNYVRRCSDKYLTSPLLELAGEKAVYLDKVLYHYLGYQQAPLNFGKSNKKWSQRALRIAVSLKPRYKKLNPKNQEY